MRNAATALLIVSVGVLGLLLYSRTADLREQRRQVQELNAKLESVLKNVSLELQEKCAKQARQQFLDLGWGKHEAAVFRNHYNQKANRCLVEVQDTESHPGRIWANDIVFDAFEGNLYAQYTHFQLELRRTHTWEDKVIVCAVTLPSGEKKTCHSKEEFDALVKQQME